MTIPWIFRSHSVLLMILGDEFNCSSIFQMGDLGKKKELTWTKSQLLKWYSQDEGPAGWLQDSWPHDVPKEMKQMKSPWNRDGLRERIFVLIFFFFLLSGLWRKLGWCIYERRKFCGGQKNLDVFGFETRPGKVKGSLTITSDPWATWVLTAWVHFNWDFFHWLVLQYYRIRGGLNSWIPRNYIYEGLTRSYTWIFNCTEGHCP